MTYKPFKTRLSILAVVAALGLSFSANAEQLDVSEGTMSLNGFATANYSSGATGIASYGGFYGGLGLGFSYFVVDNIAVGFRATATGPIHGTPSPGPLATIAPGLQSFGFGLNLEGVFSNDSIVYPYLGVGAGFLWIPSAPAATKWWVPVDPTFGILIGLNRYVALDLGIKAVVSIPVAGALSATRLDAGIGFVGARAFF